MTRARALVVDHSARANIRIQDVELGAPKPHEAVLDVHAVSLNRGECHSLAHWTAGTIPGWDTAGVVRVAAADGSGPPQGARVVAATTSGWSTVAFAPTDRIGVVPDGLDLARAATLPVAGLTAMRTLTLARVGPGSRVLVTGATGGFGLTALQLARKRGATTHALVRDARDQALVSARGADVVHVAHWPRDLAFDAILDGVGGPVLADAVRSIAPRGAIVSLGNSSAAPTSFNALDLFARAPGAHIAGFLLFPTLDEQACSDELEELCALVLKGHLDTDIVLDVEMHDAASAIEAVLDRKIKGKAVVRLQGVLPGTS